MPNVLTIDGPDAVRCSEREKVIRYKLTLSGSYVQAVRGSNVGEVIDLTKAVGVNQLNQFWGPNGPRRMYVVNAGSTGYALAIIPAADNLHWLLIIFSSLATQLVAGTYAANAAGLLTDLDILIEATGRPED